MTIRVSHEAPQLRIMVEFNEPWNEGSARRAVAMVEAAVRAARPPAQDRPTPPVAPFGDGPLPAALNHYLDGAQRFVENILHTAEPPGTGAVVEETGPPRVLCPGCGVRAIRVDVRGCPECMAMCTGEDNCAVCPRHPDPAVLEAEDNVAPVLIDVTPAAARGGFLIDTRSPDPVMAALGHSAAALDQTQQIPAVTLADPSPLFEDMHLPGGGLVGRSSDHPG